MEATSIPSYLVTDEMLTEMGFAVEIRGHIVGGTYIGQAGVRRGEALMAAVSAKLVHIESDPEVTAAYIRGVPTWAQAKGKTLPTVDAEMMAWALAAPRVKSPEKKMIRSGGFRG